MPNASRERRQRRGGEVGYGRGCRKKNWNLFLEILRLVHFVCFWCQIEVHSAVTSARRLPSFDNLAVHNTVTLKNPRYFLKPANRASLRPTQPLVIRGRGGVVIKFCRRSIASVPHWLMNTVKRSAECRVRSYKIPGQSTTF